MDEAFADPARRAPGVDHDAENRRLKRDLARLDVFVHMEMF
jgi:hypothetical protein